MKNQEPTGLTSQEKNQTLSALDALHVDFATARAGHVFQGAHCAGAPGSAASLEAMLISDNKRLREAGCELAEAAMRVAKTYDGVHRLMLACSKWALAIANEGGRERYQPND